eukprot:418013-Prymnesium_polylepis.1
MSPHVTGTAPALHPSAQHALPPRRAHQPGSVHSRLSTLPSRHMPHAIVTCTTPSRRLCVHRSALPPTCRPDARVPPPPAPT